MKKILLQTTIPYAKEDWSIERFSMLAEILSGVSNGAKPYSVTARNRENDAEGNDLVLKRLDETNFDQLWLFGVDVGGGISAADYAGIRRFRERGGGMLTSRDHQDLGISFCALVGIGPAHHFHSKNPEIDASRLVIDDTETASITWPNYHSGSNGDYQRISVADPVHPVMRSPKNASGKIEILPAHPHEGAVSAPAEERARVIAMGKSILTGRVFNLAVAFERDGALGPAIADSSFHHFLDYNLDPGKGCPSYVTEPPGRGMLENPQALEDTKTYYANLAAWLS